MASGEIERLRALLKDAGGVVEQLGDEARVEPAGSGYFAGGRASQIERLIERVAAHDGEMTMFVGAGVSMEAELPSWNTLVRRLLIGARSQTRKRSHVGSLGQWAEAVMREGPLAAASVAASLYASDAKFRRALRQALYARAPGSYLPGALAGQIASLKERMGSRLAILTVNYDGLLEQALEERGLNTISYVRGAGERHGSAAVWHLHGRMTRAGSRWQNAGDLVLSEASYVRSTARAYPQDLVAERLRGSLCLFVGLSMTDPNFIRWLYNSAAGGGQRFVIFVRQATPIADARVRRLLEESAAARWRGYRVVPVWANYYGEVAQIVHEIALRCAGGKPLDFRERAARRLQNGKAQLCPPGVKRFAAAQSEASAWLRVRLDDVRRSCQAANVDLARHKLGLGLWAVDHDSGRIMNWASADRANMDPDSQVSSSLHAGSRWIAAGAISSGVSIEQDPNVYASRWRFVRAMPIVADQYGERSIVGALTLTSTTPLDRFPLAQAKAPTGLLGDIDRFLTRQAAEFFFD